MIYANIHLPAVYWLILASAFVFAVFEAAGISAGRADRWLENHPPTELGPELNQENLMSSDLPDITPARPDFTEPPRPVMDAKLRRKLLKRILS